MSPADTHTDKSLPLAGIGSVRLVTEGAVRSKLVRALKRLRGLFEQSNNDAREARP
jgi:hypothetical protein